MSVLKQLLNAFRASEPEPLPDPDAKLAIGALMVQVALSDANYQLEEISLIDHMLARLFNLGPIEAAKMRATCEKLHAAAPDTETFAALIRSELGVQDRCDALSALWQVVMANDEMQASGTAIVEAARLQLGLSVADNAAARSRAESELA